MTLSSRRRWTPRRCLTLCSKFPTVLQPQYVRCAPSFSLLAQLASRRSSLACGDQRCGEAPFLLIFLQLFNCLYLHAHTQLFMISLSISKMLSFLTKGVLLRSMLEFAVLRPSVDSDSDLLSILSFVLGGVEMSFKRSSV